MRALARGWSDLAETLVIVRLESGEVWRLGVNNDGTPLAESVAHGWARERERAKRHARERGMVEMPASVARAYAML